MVELVEKYIEDKRLAWRPMSLRNERYRLKKWAQFVDGKPEGLWNEMLAQEIQPYSRSTIYTRCCDFYQWAIDAGHIQGPNHYRIWRKRNALQFKNVYVRKPARHSFAEAKERLMRLKDRAAREYAHYLLDHGLRFTESTTLDAENFIVGKGGKRREVHVRPGFRKPAGVSYHRLRIALKEVGLKPHELRKVFATDFIRRGGDAFDLMRVMGWASIGTAQSYVAANTAKIKALLASRHDVVSRISGWVREKAQGLVIAFRELVPIGAAA